MKHLFIFLVMVFGISIGSAQQTGYYYNIATKEIMFFGSDTHTLINVNDNLKWELEYIITIDGVELYRSVDTRVFMLEGHIIIPTGENDIVVIKYLGLRPSEFIDRCPFIDDYMKSYLLSVEKKTDENIAKRLNGGA